MLCEHGCGLKEEALSCTRGEFVFLEYKRSFMP
jgi:hypothetical protein